MVFLRIPIGLAMFLCGVGGSWIITGSPAPMLGQLKQIAYSTFSDYKLSVVPLFLLMGQFAAYGGISGKLFATAENWLGHRKGGLAMAAIGACAGFGAICGSSLATAATMGQVALPELRRHGYSGRAGHRHAGGRRHARHPHPALGHPGHLRHPHRAEHRQAVRRRLRAGHAGGHRLHDRHPHLSSGSTRRRPVRAGRACRMAGASSSSPGSGTS